MSFNKDVNYLIKRRYESEINDLFDMMMANKMSRSTFYKSKYTKHCLKMSNTKSNHELINNMNNICYIWSSGG